MMLPLALSLPTASEWLRSVPLARRTPFYYYGAFRTGEFGYETLNGQSGPPWPVAVRRVLELSAGQRAAWSSAVDARTDGAAAASPPPLLRSRSRSPLPLRRHGGFCSLLHVGCCALFCVHFVIACCLCTLLISYLIEPLYCPIVWNVRSHDS